MNILIVDDEKLTRESLASGLPWENLGFERVEIAADGLQALDRCSDFYPDVLLSDVRMPRMDGIHLAEALQKKNPDICVIFMSGYSDKEYLKAAIRLKAVRYVEKPIDLQELSEALQDACASAAENAATRRLRSSSRIRDNMEAALAMTIAGSEAVLPLPKKEIQCAFTGVIRFYRTFTEFSQLMAGEMNELFLAIGLTVIHAAKQPSLYVLQFFSNREISKPQTAFLARRMTEILTHRTNAFHLVLGPQCSGSENLFASYNSCIVGLQRVFFQPVSTAFLCDQMPEGGDIADLESSHPEADFRKLLTQEQEKTVQNWRKSLLTVICEDPGMMPPQVREVYFRLLSEVYETAKTAHVALRAERGTLWESVSFCPTVFALDELLESLITEYFSASVKSQVSSPVFHIQGYIARHLSDPNLSIKAIGDDAHLSSSYVCTLFKAETGQTLTHYITELRMEKAKELLADPRNRVSEISSMVGFGDRNYFSKAFKKAYGLSPSEFRDSLNGSPAED